MSSHLLDLAQATSELDSEVKLDEDDLKALREMDSGEQVAEEEEGVGVAPVWAGAAMILFVPIFIAAQAAYFALPVTYPVATACLGR